MVRYIVEVQDALGDWGDTDVVADTPEQAIDKVNHRLSGTASEARHTRLDERHVAFAAGQTIHTIDGRVGIITEISASRLHWVHLGAGQREPFHSHQLSLASEAAASVARTA